MQGGHKESRSVAFIITGVVIVVVAAFFSLLINQMLNSTTDLYVNGTKFTAVVVKNSVSQASDWGTSDKTTLLEFTNNARWSASASELKKSVDIVWLSDDKKIVYMLSDVSPGDDRNLTPSSMAKYAIELPAGTLKSRSINIGDSVAF